MSEHLQLENYAFSRGFTIDKYRVYNDYLNFQKIKMLSREGKQIQPVTLTLPTGKRNYVEHVTKFYKHRRPGKRSTSFDITVVNQSLSSSETQQQLADQIRDFIEPIIPVNSQLNNINWIT